MQIDMIRRIYAQIREDVGAAMYQAAGKANINLDMRGLAIASSGEAFIAGVPTTPEADGMPRVFLYLDVPHLGQCSNLLPPDFYLVELITSPFRAQFTKSDGKRVLVNNVMLESKSRNQGTQPYLELSIGPGVADVCVPYSEEVREIVWFKLSADDPDN